VRKIAPNNSATTVSFKRNAPQLSARVRRRFTFFKKNSYAAPELRPDVI